MLQAMNTGHDGSISTVHANAPRDALSRLETMVLMAGFDLPAKAIREQIASALNVIIQVARLSDGDPEDRQGHRGHRHGGGGGRDAGHLRLREAAASTGTGRCMGEFRATGVRPKFLDTIHAAGDPPRRRDLRVPEEREGRPTMICDPHSSSSRRPPGDGRGVLPPVGRASEKAPEVKRRLALLELRGIGIADIPDVLKNELLSEVPLLSRLLSRVNIGRQDRPHGCGRRT